MKEHLGKLNIHNNFQVNENFQQQVADYIVSVLEKLGVEYVFGVPGGAIEPLYNALARSERRGGIRPIVARHEAGAAFMADGHARATGKLGVCCSTSGPGATNLITGVASAHADFSPLLVITSQPKLPNLGKLALQDNSCASIDIVAMMKSCTNFSSLVSHPQQLQHKLQLALNASLLGSKGASHISFPRDVLEGKVNFKLDNALALTAPPLFQDDTKVDKFARLLLSTNTVTFVVGGKCNEEVGELIHRLSWTMGHSIVSTPIGKKWIRSGSYNYYGVFGFGGHASATKRLYESDLVVAIGVLFDELGTAAWCRDYLLTEKLIHIDDDLSAFANTVMAREHIFGNAETILKSIFLKIEIKKMCFDRSFEEVKTYPPTRIELQENVDALDESGKIKPQALMKLLSENVADDCVFFIDAGNSWAWSIHYLHLKGMGKYNIGTGWGAMAWGISAAIGSALSGQKNICITGDGAFLMSSHELTVAVSEKLPVIFILLNDSALGMVKHGQRLAESEEIAFQLPEVDYCKIASAYGVTGMRVSSIMELKQVNFDSLFKLGGPVLLELIIDGEEVPPMGTRMKVLTQ